MMKSDEKRIGSKYLAPSYGKELMLSLIEDVDGDTGKGIARLGPEVRRELDVGVGDFIEVIGPKSLKFRVDKLEEISDRKSGITMDRDLRQKMFLSVGIEVFVRKSKKSKK